MNAHEQKRAIKKQKKLEELFRYNPFFYQFILLFHKLFSKSTTPTEVNLILLALSMLYLDACPSVLGMYTRFIKKYSVKALASLYYTLNSAKSVMSTEWQYLLLEIILSKVEVIRSLPILIIFDDTLVEKIGDKFELICKLYDHNRKNGSNYLKGHCFVSLVVGIPIRQNGKAKYIKVPLCHRMWDKEAKVPVIDESGSSAVDESKADETAANAVGESVPNTASGTEPGTAEGNELGTVEGTEPGTAEGNELGTVEGTEPGTAEGNELGTVEGTEPGTAEGNEPVTTEGTEPKTENETKLRIAYDMAFALYNRLKDRFKFCILCDSWYPKGVVLKLHKELGIPFVCAVRIDTTLYDLPGQNPPGKRGPKPTRGEVLSKDLDEVFEFHAIPGYKFLIGSRKVITSLFGATVCTAYATKPNPKDAEAKETAKNQTALPAEGEKADEIKADEIKTDEIKTDEIKPEDSRKAKLADSKKSREAGINLFIATDGLDLTDFDLGMIESEEIKALVTVDPIYRPFALYKYRWFIEECYYELKTFWNFNKYFLRHKGGIENLTNLQTLVYAVMSVLPYISKTFAGLLNMSAQERRYHVSELLRRVINFSSFVDYAEAHGVSRKFIARCENYLENEIGLDIAQ